MDRRPPARNMQALDNLRKMKWKHKEYSDGSKNRRKNMANSMNASRESRNTGKNESDKENDLRQMSTPVGQTNGDAMKIASQIPSKKEALENPSSSNMSHDLDQLLDRLDAARLNDLAKVESEIVVSKIEEGALFNNLKKAYQESNFPDNAEQDQAYSQTFQHQTEPVETIPFTMPTLNRMDPRGTVSQPTYNSNSLLSYIIPETQQNCGYSTLPPNEIHEAEPTKPMSEHSQFSSALTISGVQQNQEYSMLPQNQNVEMPAPSATNFSSNISPADPVFGVQQDHGYSTGSSVQMRENGSMQSMSRTAMHLDARMPTHYSVSGSPPNREYSASAQNRLAEMQPYQRMPPSENRPSRFYPELHSNSSLDTEPARSKSPPARYVNSQMPEPYSLCGMSQNREYSMPTQIQLRDTQPHSNSMSEIQSENFHSNTPSKMYLHQHMPPSHSVSGVPDSQVYSVPTPNQLLDTQQVQRMMQKPPPVSVSGILSNRVNYTTSSMEPMQSTSQPGVYQMTPSYSNAPRVPENEDFCTLPHGQLPDMQPIARVLQRSPSDSVSRHGYSSVTKPPRMYHNSQTSPSYSDSEVPLNQMYSMLPNSHIPERQPTQGMSQIPPSDTACGMQSNHIHSGVPNMKPMQSTSKPIAYRDSEVPPLYSVSDGQMNPMYSSPPSIGAAEMEFVKPKPPANYGSYISPPRSHPGVQQNRAYAPPAPQNRMFEEEHANPMSQVAADFRFNSRSSYPIDEMRENQLYSPPPQMEPRTAVRQHPMNANSHFAPHSASDPSHHQIQSTHVSNRTLEMAVAQFTCPGNVDSYLPPNECSISPRNAEGISPPANITREMELAISLSQQAPMTFNSQISPPYSRSGIPREPVPAQTRLPETDPTQMMNCNSSVYYSATEFQDNRPPIRSQMYAMERNHMHDERAPSYVEQGLQFQDPTPFPYEDHRPCQEPPPVHIDSNPRPVSSGQQYRLNRSPRPRSPVPVTQKDVSPAKPEEKPVELMPPIPGKIFFPRTSPRKEVSPETIEEWNNPKSKVTWREFGKIVKAVEKTYSPDYKDCDGEEDRLQMPNSEQVVSPIEHADEHFDAQQPSINGEQSLEEPHSFGKTRLEENEQSRYHSQELGRQNFIRPTRGILKRNVTESKKVSFHLMS